MTTWVLERDVFSDRDEALASAANAAGADVIGWRDEWWTDRRWPRSDGAVIFHGSLGNADRVGRELPWTPGVFCSTADFACSRWWPHVAEDLLTPNYLLTTVADLVRDGSPEAFGERVFIRPDSPLKPFSGRVLQRDRITLDALDYGYYYDDAALPIVVAPEVPVSAEWRFVVADGTVIAGSEYIADGRVAGSGLSPQHRVWEFATELAARIPAPDPVYVLDVCESHTRLRLLELNPFSGADLYGCDRKAVVQAVQALLVHRHRR